MPDKMRFEIKSYSDAARALERERGSVLKQHHDLERYDKALASYNRELRLAKQYGLSKSRVGRLKIVGRKLAKTSVEYSKTSARRAIGSTIKRGLGQRKYKEMSVIYKRIVA